ncbi:hypothetical protein D3C75_942220 [compost metagenome]
MHGVETGQKCRIACGITLQRAHPAARNSLSTRILGTCPIVHQLLYRAHHLLPFPITRFVGLIERQLRQFVGGKVFIVHGHHLQRDQPIIQFGFTALGQLGVHML